MTIKDTKEAKRWIGSNNDQSSKVHAYVTPEIVTVKLMEYERFGQKILEPAAGLGDMSEVIKRYGYDVTSSDLYDWGYCPGGIDFITSDYKGFDAIVTNPPFDKPRGISMKFTIKALEITKETKGKVAILQKLTWLEGQTRSKLFDNYPLSKILVFRKRIPRCHIFHYDGPKSTSMIAFAWYIWDWCHKGKAIVDWI